MPIFYLEDFAPGQKHVTGILRVDADAIKAFAREFDPQPFHLDEEAARGSLFGGLAASGWHTAALTITTLNQDREPVQVLIMNLLVQSRATDGVER